MEPDTGLSFFYQLLIIFSFSVIAISLCYRLKIPESLAYLFVGLILGPSILNIVSDSHQVSFLAEVGVVFLLFSLGLEFSLSKMMSMKRLVFGLGLLQVAITTLIVWFIGYLSGLPSIASLVMATGLSLSSTAIVSKELTRRNEVHTSYGEAAIGTLIFQDIAAVIFLIIISALAGGDDEDLGFALLFSFIKGIIFVLIMMFFGKKILPRIFHEVASTRSEELFVLAAIVAALLAAMCSHILGLSMALGGFVAGMMLGENHFKHQIETDIRPFRDILLGLFFVSIGLMLNVDKLMVHWWIILLGATALIAFKIALVTLLGSVIGLKRKCALKTSLALAHGGEFCFAIIALASHHQLVSDTVGSIVLSIAIISMITTPFFMRYSEQIVQIFHGKKPKKLRISNDVAPVEAAISNLNGHILICGYGRVGQVIGRFLSDDDISYVALDDDPLHVKEANQAGETVFFGDCRRKDILVAAGVTRAKMAIICLDNAMTANEVLMLIKGLNKPLPVLVRTRDDNMMETLYRNGATRLVPEVLESSLLIVSHVMNMLGKSQLEIKRRISAVRKKKYRRLHGFFIGQTEPMYTPEGLPTNLRHGFTMTASHNVVGKMPSNIPFEEMGVEIDKVIRDKHHIEPENISSIQVGDILLLTGSAEALVNAEEILIKG